MKYLSEKRGVDAWWGVYPENHGDLVSMSYLDFVPAFKHIEGPTLIKRPYSGPANTVLYLNGDSYTQHLDPSLLNGLAAYHYISRYGPSSYYLDTTKNNILVIEIAERIFRPYFDSLRMIHDFTPARLAETIFAHPAYGAILPDMSNLFNSNINQNLQFNLFNYQCLMPLFESKAALNYYAFKRASGRVVISDDGSFLFLKETVSYTGTSSAYSPLTPDDITLLVNNLNITYDHFRAAGFKEVYLSVIPSSATIVQSKGYNNLIPLVQNDARLKIKIIDVYSAFRNNTEQLYQPGDSHWNNKGLQIFIDLLDKVIAKHNKQI